MVEKNSPVAVALVTLMLGACSCHQAPAQISAEAAEHSRAAPVYVCPMHAEVISDHAGACPICGMQLAAKDVHPEGEGSGSGSAAAASAYVCPMHAEVTSDHPGTCSICGMQLVPKPGHAGVETGAGVPGLAPVVVEPSMGARLGLKRVPVRAGVLAGHWRTVGRVVADETRVRRVTVKVEGYVDRLYADFIGKSVRRGQPLLSLYSPELLSAQNDYLVARQLQQRLRGGDEHGGQRDLVAAARQRLRLWDISEASLAGIESSGVALRTLTLDSPIAGVVVAKSVVEGAHVSPGDTLFEITDLSVVWVLADVYESDLRRMRLGLPAQLTLSALPGRTFVGSVSFVPPILDATTRTAQVRLNFANPTGDLRPELFGEVTLTDSARSGLRIPIDAVIRAGSRTVAFVAETQTRFVPRTVQLGQAVGEAEVEVLAGLREGDYVVTGASFLLDSEARLTAPMPAPMPAAAAAP